MRFLTAGESHGPQLTTIIDGLPAGLAVDLDRLNFQLSRRQKGYGRGGRMKIEEDRAQIVSGVRGGWTMGGPVTLVIVNRDWENWSQIMDPIKPIPADLGLKLERLARETTKPRPGHADLPGGVKYNHHDLRNVLERASARETAARVAAGSLARQFLESFGVEFASHVIRIGSVPLATDVDTGDLAAFADKVENSEVRCANKTTEEKMIEAIRQAKKKRDSLGGVVELIVRGLPIGLGSYVQWDRRLDGRLAGAMMSIQSIKGVEIGDGFASAGRRGSQVHDQIYFEKDASAGSKGFTRRSNNAGGLEGGITNGEDLVIRSAVKPISTLNQPLHTVDVQSKEAAEAMVERTDNCVVPAVGVICEAMAALVLADAFMDKFGADNMKEIERNYQSFLDAQY
ncbi:chorismate synthase [candidate division GN15 bacterium]|nr:chorismate synthase [candidate division GN15 bacterium]